MPTDAQNIATTRAALCGAATGYPDTVLDVLGRACDDLRALCTEHGLTIPGSDSSGPSGPYWVVVKPSDDCAQQSASRWPRAGANHNARDLALYAEKLADYLRATLPIVEPGPPSFDLYASLSGSDSDPGTAAAPFRTVEKLVDSLAPGQVGALAPGVYVEDVGTHNRSGITVTSVDPANPATLKGRLYVPEGSDDVTFYGLNIDGRNTSGLPSPTVNGDRAQFLGSDVTNHNTGIAFVLGHPDFGVPDGTRIAGCRIHDCGRLPRTNHDHGVYVSYATNTVIEDCWIYDNADRGVQLYPNAQSTVIRHNVIDSNGSGVIFSGDGVRHSDNNLVENNIITRNARYNVEEHWAGGPVGVGNVVTGNCLWAGNGDGNISPAPVGFTATGNTVGDPGYADPAGGDFTPDPAGPAAGLGPR